MFSFQTSLLNPIQSVCFYVTTVLMMLYIGPSGAANGADFNPLPDTGQEKCYNDSGNEIVCPLPGEPFYGQDANYKGLQPSFTKKTINGNTVVIDNNTGLMWQQADDGVKRTWEEAKEYCESLTFAGYDDWRLPSYMELESIVDYGRYDPSIDTSVFECRSSGYWSSNTGTDVPDGAWVIYFKYGYSYWYHRSLYDYVRCVRGSL